MIYASDLDRTLIYSQSFIDMHPTTSKLILVDKSKVNSYMAEEVADRLGRLIKSEEVEFIPVTTRSISEYERINFPFNSPEYAITTCGGKILHNGEIMQEWEEEVAEGKNIDELLQICTELDKLSSTNYESRIVDGCYAFSKSSDIHKTKEELAELQLKYPHYRICLDKHKVYAIPDCIGKDKALKWLKHYRNEDKIVASGDSTFDVPMLNISDIAVIPSHKSIKSLEKGYGRFIEVDGEVLSPLNTLEIIEKQLNSI